MEIVSFAIDWALPLLWTRHDSLDGRGSYVSSSTPWRLAGWIRLKSGWQPWRLEYMINDIWHMTHYMWYCIYIHTYYIYNRMYEPPKLCVYIYIYTISVVCLGSYDIAMKKWCVSSLDLPESLASQRLLKNGAGNCPFLIRNWMFNCGIWCPWWFFFVLENTWTHMLKPMDGWMVTRLIWRIIYAKPSFYYPSGKGSCWRGFPSEGTGGVFKAGSSRGLVWFTELQCLSNK